ncbi:glycine--tRNA ligase subunit beta [Acidocella sp. KAb 2-4]|uniref:glycine--tRNA ligase subunit beta n=1 Tax=Acidocella sp. KAb 2-4 TaxID=2885158 RepID=UPI001D0832CE|nr:glycine--tRNA ligase subunit beta [Acidocella sp. KAb 2-4]MCB5945773.1 glycine--tRNA ligase subunit beta [Acidocella sp. KAb 2-4]
MPEFFLELFSEEIPARMQAGAAAELERLLAPVFAELKAEGIRSYYGPRRVAIAASVAAEKPGSAVEERGPRDSAPEQALAGFLRKHNAAREELVAENGYYVLRRDLPPVAAAALLCEALPGALAKFSWPKSMRWGASGEFTWVRPLRRVVCLLDGAVVPFSLGPVTSGDETEGHRMHGHGLVAVSSVAVWEEKLREHRVIVDQAERRRLIAEGMAEQAAALGLSVVPDEALLDEVTGLVEWPVPLLGKIDGAFMALPPEVRELSMKINQKYFALRDAAGQPAPYFAFAANLEAPDGGAAIVAGNERVLRARLSDARHFWELDLKTELEFLLPRLDKITFHAKIGTQRARVRRIEELAAEIAELLGADGDELMSAQLAARWCKADLVTGMVGEFPELQGVMGGYYAAHGAEDDPLAQMVGQAIRSHYQPKGPSDEVPAGTAAVAVALADKLDTLREFFRIGEKPTGSGDPYALRRCALGVIRIILENGLRLHLKPLLNEDEELFGFIIERLRVKLRGEGKRFDILDAVLAAGADDDLVRVMRRVEALEAMLGTSNGKSLHAAYKRAANILRIEEEKDGVKYDHAFEVSLFGEAAEKALARDCGAVEAALQSDDGLMAQERFSDAMTVLSALRAAIDAFFEKVTVNAEMPELRRNRLRLLARFRDTVNQIADFSRVEV